MKEALPIAVIAGYPLAGVVLAYAALPHLWAWARSETSNETAARRDVQFATVLVVLGWLVAIPVLVGVWGFAKMIEARDPGRETDDDE